MVALHPKIMVEVAGAAEGKRWKGFFCLSDITRAGVVHVMGCTHPCVTPKPAKWIYQLASFEALEYFNPELSPDKVAKEVGFLGL
jgi:hypothetical protein